MSKSKLIRTTVDEPVYEELESAAKEKNLGLSLFLRTLLGAWVAKRQAKRLQEQREAEEGRTYGP